MGESGRNDATCGVSNCSRKRVNRLGLVGFFKMRILKESHNFKLA